MTAGRSGGKGGSGIVIVRYVEVSDLPRITSETATNVTLTSACLNGTLNGTGTSATAVSVYWGPSDGGASAGNWAHTNDFGLFTGGSLPWAYATNVTLLSSNAFYYYRYYATNGTSAAWGGVQKIMTGNVWLDPTSANASRSGPTTATITVWRASSLTNEPVVVKYGLGGTATSVNDYQPLTGSVTIDAGASNATIVVTPVVDALAGDDKTAIITLATGANAIGSPSSATVNILSAGVMWNGSASGLWNNTNNWRRGTKPTDYGPTVFFGAVGAANKTVTNDIGSLDHLTSGIVFANGGGYTLVASGSLHYDPGLIYSYGGSNVIQSGVLNNTMMPALVLTTNNSQLIIGNGMGNNGSSSLRAASDSTIVLNGTLAGGNYTFDGPGNYVLNGSMTTPNNVYLNAGTITLNANDTLSGSLADGAAVLVAGGGARSFQSGDLVSQNGNDFLFGGTNDFIFSGKIRRGASFVLSNINVTNPAVRVTVLGGASAGNPYYTQPTKKGPGTLVIKGNGLPSDTTLKFQVDAGTLLLIDGTNTWANNNGVDAITVASGATLGGMNTEVNLGGQRVVTIQSGGTLNPGDPRVNTGIGTLALGTSGSLGSTVLASGSTNRIDVGAATTDVLVVNGNLTLTGSSLQLNQAAGTKPVAGTYTIATYSGTRTGQFSSTNYNGTASKFQVNYGAASNGAILLTLTVNRAGMAVFFR